MATGTAEFIDATTAANNIPVIWSKSAIVARESKCLFLDRVNRQFEKDLRMGATVHVLSIGNLTAQTKNTSSNTAISYETVTETNTDLTVDTWGYTGVALEEFTGNQINVDMLAKYAEKQGYALALQIDDTLAGRPDDFSQSVGTLTVDFTYEDVLQAVMLLDAADVPGSDRTMLISANQKAGAMKLDQFIHRDYSALNADANQAAKDSSLGSWMGIPVLWSTNVEGSTAVGHDNAIMHREAVACVVQQEPKTRTFDDIDYLCMKVVMSQVYGVAEMRDDHGIWLKGS